MTAHTLNADGSMGDVQRGVSGLPVGHGAFGSIVDAHAHPGAAQEQRAVSVVRLCAGRQPQHLLGPGRVQQAVLRLHGKQQRLRHRGECDVEGVALSVDLIAIVFGNPFPYHLQVEKRLSLPVVPLVALLFSNGVDWQEQLDNSRLQQLSTEMENLRCRGSPALSGRRGGWQQPALWSSAGR